MVISSSSEELLHPSPADDGFDGPGPISKVLLLLPSPAEGFDGPYNALVHPSPADGWDPVINILVNRYQYNRTVLWIPVLWIRNFSDCIRMRNSLYNVFRIRAQLTNTYKIKYDGKGAEMGF
jgi:hypothetical protein